MLRFVITLFFVGTCVANLDNLWTTFKSLHNRNYSAKEDSLRKSIFESSIKHVNDHNLHYDLGLSSYRLGLNKFADMTSDEFLQYKGLQFNASAVASSSGPSQSIVSADNLPAKVDWREKECVTPVKNQKQCGSCWAFSATGALEGANAAKTGTLVSLSEQQLVDCSSKYGNQGCNGGWPNNAFKYIKDNGGLYTEQDYAYTARDGTCHTGRGQKTTCTGYVDIPKANEIALQQAVATKGPVAVCIDASHRSFQLYNGGVYDERLCSSTRIDHAVLAVGYGTDDKGLDYWLVKNSWDTNWGERGYIRMSRNKNNQCAIASYASYPTV